MPERNGSAESIDEFFGASNIDNDNDDKKTKQNDISPTSAVAALIKSQPVVHHRQTSLEKKRKFLVSCIFNLFLNFICQSYQ
jgi:hypothetical protein